MCTPVPGRRRPSRSRSSRSSRPRCRRASITLMWVVQGDRGRPSDTRRVCHLAARGSLEHAPHGAAAVERALERGRPLRLRRAQRARERDAPGASTPLGGGPAASTPSACAIRTPPDEGGGFVTNVRSRYGQRTGGGGSRGRRAGRGGEGRRRPPGASTSACAVSPSANSLGAVLGVALERVGERRVAVRSPSRSSSAAGPKTARPRAAPRKRVEDRVQVGVRGVSSRRRARARSPGSTSSANGSRPRAGGPPRGPTATPGHGARPGPDEERLRGRAELDVQLLERRDARPLWPAPGTAVKKSRRAGAARARRARA